MTQARTNSGTSWRMTPSCLASTCVAVFLLALASPSMANLAISSPLSADTAASTSSAPAYETFAPRPATTTRLDFSDWDRVLKGILTYGGPSLREKARRPRALTGTRFAMGHRSPYRLEGNKVVFEEIEGELLVQLNQYVDDLVSLGNARDISTLPRNEQLAYWLNLHNAIVVTEIANRYPVMRPARIEGEDGQRFHDTKWVTIKGVPLSLRNIREDIVYRNWSDPVVMYGFFHGDIGSPSLQRTAYTSETLRRTLRASADEFANSLRGFQMGRTGPSVSRLYRDAAPFFFPDFDADMRSHLNGLLKAELREELGADRSPVRAKQYEYIVADLTGGRGNRIPAGLLQITDRREGQVISSTMQRALREQHDKYEELQKRGLLGTVTIEDIDTDDPADTVIR